ncbi:TetR/AcrR family transcriptional regulator [Propionibacterium australiense]|uniref:DNA-binding HTH domain, TetR-type n=1 Tax=Propionibacterium australiense TaxID=119981 RepID=A0A383S6X1_9ACTN|nr:TetR/AcrR family transcriptional regulator [Propionibacterium australiense]RLP10081.1 TetR family transcriptional regulator [Propionibacterium australiense]RLP11364.1 TetR family transcriptional regulator [Propionibacterium australiense]SYZ33006.1 DNA-binding HTH domain, TetR-type [Propionibacterium australiense]VEH92257.1 transcriptional regulator BetI [Propionibacterium australiense]
MASSDERAPRRRLSVAERRLQILEAARRLYATTPYAQLPVTRVAEAAEASAALVFHYFGSKAGLYEAVVADAVQRLADAQRAADAALPAGVPARDRVRTGLLIYLDHIAGHPHTWATPLTGGEEPAEVVRLRHRVRAGYVEELGRVLDPSDTARHDYALWGYFGFLDQACLRWVERGCPADDRHQLADAALGALEGALGDWGA